MPNVSASNLKALARLSSNLIEIDKRKKAAEADYKDARKRVFALVDGIAGPESKFTVEVAETGRRIGRTIRSAKPRLDAEALQQVLPPDVYAAVTHEVTTITTEIDYEALKKALDEERVSGSTLEKAIIVGDPVPVLLHNKIGSAEDKRFQEAEATPTKERSPAEELLEF